MNVADAQLRPTRREAFASRAVVWFERSHARLCALLILLSLACFLPGFSTLQPMDRDEPRYAQASKQMLETGDFVDIRFQDEARHKKPVGIYWIQSGVVALGEHLGISDARTTIALYRLPSLAGALSAVLLTYWAALAFLGRRGAFLAASLMAASVILMVEARLAKTDAALLACCVAAMGGLARAYLSRGAGRLPLGTLAAFWLGFALGALIKGPLVLMFVGLAALVLSWRERSFRWLSVLKPWPGLLFTLVVVLPWFAAIAVKSHGEFFAASVGHDMLGKVGTAQKVHWAPPGFYLAAFFATFWPGAILAAIAVRFAWTNRRDDAVAFLLAWIVPAWLVFEAVPTKLPHYVMPLYPAIAILVVIAMARGFLGPHRPLARVSTFLIPFIPLGLTLGVSAVSWSFDETLPYRALPPLVLSTALAFYAWFLFVRARVVHSLLASLISAAFLALGVFGFAQLDLRSLKLSPRLAEVARNLGCADPAVATLGYREPSLVFLTGTKLEMLETGSEAAAFLKQGGCRIVFVDERFDEDFRAETERLGFEPALSTRVIGFNINSGRRVDIGAYSAVP
ncbi:ArnT family glycosyltransferase [Microvirga pudoricolor]|uniref:ArnT family glycosyltransferase n=1 Tax=Microvirga pudoricolor TaxID=2778729 RepID=UPI00194E1A46|nr:glycosyltransferase family 39 protein [Microvirga pudoricolor]MBM6594255.1 glycosyltransferase family 39 protein [Microvirga pudoricolor]